MKKPVFLKQTMMTKVIYALIPICFIAIYYFGWRVLAIVLTSFIFAFFTEWIMVSKRKNGKVTYACFVTAFLYGLSLPPTIPLWIVAVGAVIAILFGKETFGGFGKNVFNPAIVGRAFVYVSFPQEMTSKFTPVFRDFPGGFAQWSFESLKHTPEYIKAVGMKHIDAVSAATPMWSRCDFGYITDLSQLIKGNISGTFSYENTNMCLSAGSIGEVCAIAIVIAGIYLMWTKTAKWELTVSTILGAVFLNVLLRNICGIEQVPPVLFTLFSGAFLYAAVFMVTDPISAPKLVSSRWIYGAFIGMLVVFFRYKAIFAGGVGFAIIIGNMFAPSFDLWINRLKAARKRRQHEKK